jgi:hypothetical protein
LPRDRNFLQFGCISRRYYCRSGQNGRLQTRLKPESHVLVFDRLLESGLSSQGVLAVSAASVHGPFWCISPDVGLGTDSFVKNIIATVASACVAALKEAGAISEKTALSIVPSIRTATNVVSSLRN